MNIISFHQDNVGKYCAESKKHRLEQAAGKVFLHPFDDLSLIAGHGTVGQEVVQAVPGVDLVLVCCGGGGLLAGTATAVKVVYFNNALVVRSGEKNESALAFISNNITPYLQIFDSLPTSYVRMSRRRGGPGAGWWGWSRSPPAPCSALCSPADPLGWQKLRQGSTLFMKGSQSRHY